MRLVYTVFINLYGFLLSVAALFDSRAAQWVKGRRNQELPTLNDNAGLLWIHAASLGEFEQGRPVIEIIKKKYPDKKILLTFFSPSGYEVRKNYELADYVFYLPLDTPRNVNEFLDSFKPSVAIFVKYEYWYNFIYGLQKRNIPYYYLSAIYRKKQIFFKFYGGWFRNHLKKASRIFCQDNESAGLLSSMGFDNVTVAGDTRFDRVVSVTANPRKMREIESFVGENKTILAGSTWPPDEEILAKFMGKAGENIKLIVAPHLTDDEHIAETENKFKKFGVVRLSRLRADGGNNEGSILIIDGVGFLMHLYQYCDFAYIGGGFGVGIHNILEAAAFGKPVVFGPNHKKFREAVELISLGGAFAISSAEDFSEIADKMFGDGGFYSKAADIAGRYVKNNTGAADIAVNIISL